MGTHAAVCGENLRAVKCFDGCFQSRFLWLGRIGEEGRTLSPSPLPPSRSFDLSISPCVSLCFLLALFLVYISSSFIAPPPPPRSRISCCNAGGMGWESRGANQKSRLPRGSGSDHLTSYLPFPSSYPLTPAPLVLSPRAGGAARMVHGGRWGGGDGSRSVGGVGGLVVGVDRSLSPHPTRRWRTPHRYTIDAARRGKASDGGFASFGVGGTGSGGDGGGGVDAGSWRVTRTACIGDIEPQNQAIDGVGRGRGTRAREIQFSRGNWKNRIGRGSNGRMEREAAREDGHGWGGREGRARGWCDLECNESLLRVAWEVQEVPYSFVVFLPPPLPGIHMRATAKITAECVRT